MAAHRPGVDVHICHDKFSDFQGRKCHINNNLLMSVIGLGQPALPWSFSLDGLQIAVLIAAFIVALGLPEPYEMSQRQFWKLPWLATGAAVLLVAIIIYLGGPFEQEFIYFQF